MKPTGAGPDILGIIREQHVGSDDADEHRSTDHFATKSEMPVALAVTDRLVSDHRAFRWLSEDALKGNRIIWRET
jgi:hypothetical protein